MAVQLALSLDATPPGTYRQRGTSSLQRLFRAHFPELVARYDAEFAKQLGRFRLERISKAVERFLACGDYPLSGSGVFSRRVSCRGIARIKCTNPDCGLEYFRLFSCSVFHSLVGPPHRLCPSCSQKRTLLLGEYMNEQLLLRLPATSIMCQRTKGTSVGRGCDKRGAFEPARSMLRNQRKSASG